MQYLKKTENLLRYTVSKFMHETYGVKYGSKDI